jgi:hypothetical protein
MAHDLYDLTQHPPRSPRVRLGGLVILPRMIDKARATKAGKNGEYTYGCSLDRNVLDFLGVEANELKAQIDKGLGDGEILAWLMANAKKPRSGQEIAAFSAYHEQRAPAPPPVEPSSRNTSLRPRPAPSARISSPGSTSWTWTTTRASAARSEPWPRTVNPVGCFWSAWATSAVRRPRKPCSASKRGRRA